MAGQQAAWQGASLARRGGRGLSPAAQLTTLPWMCAPAPAPSLGFTRKLLHAADAPPPVALRASLPPPLFWPSAPLHSIPPPPPKSPCAEEGEVYSWGWPASGRLGHSFAAGEGEEGEGALLARSVWVPRRVDLLRSVRVKQASGAGTRHGWLVGAGTHPGMCYHACSAPAAGGTCLLRTGTGR